MDDSFRKSVSDAIQQERLRRKLDALPAQISRAETADALGRLHESVSKAYVELRASDQNHCEAFASLMGCIGDALGRLDA